jgi:hypothetical protein
MKVFLEVDTDLLEREAIDSLVASIEEEFDVPVAVLAADAGFTAYLDEVPLFSSSRGEATPDTEDILEHLRAALRATLAATGTSDSPEPVVVQPSRRLFAFAAIAAALVLALGTYGVLGGPRLRMPWPPELLIVLGIVLPLMMALQWGRRIVVTRDEIVETRRGREVARAPIRSIERFGFSWTGRSLIFAGGVRIPFNELWDNGGWLKSSFAVLIDARRGGVRQEGNWVTLDFLRFPDRCLGCGGKRCEPRRIFVGYRIIAGFVSVWYGEPVFVPACRACRRRHRIAYLLTWFVGLPLLGVAIFGLTYLMSLVAGEMAAITTAAVLVIASMLILPNAVPVVLDSHYLGIGSASIRADKSKAWIHFKSPALRDELLALAQEAQMEHLHAAAVYLKEGERLPSRADHLQR